MSVKGDWPRACQTTKEEKDLRWLYLKGKISLIVFDKRYKELKRNDLITRSGKVVK